MKKARGLRDRGLRVCEFPHGLLADDSLSWMVWAWMEFEDWFDGLDLWIGRDACVDTCGSWEMRACWGFVELFLFSLMDFMAMLLAFVFIVLIAIRSIMLAFRMIHKLDAMPATDITIGFYLFNNCARVSLA